MSIMSPCYHLLAMEFLDILSPGDSKLKQTYLVSAVSAMLGGCLARTTLLTMSLCQSLRADHQSSHLLKIHILFRSVVSVYQLGALVSTTSAQGKPRLTTWRSW